MAKVLSAGELITLRTRDQYSQLYLGIYNPPTRAVLMADIPIVTGSNWNIGVAEVPFTYIAGLSGSWLADMTMYIGPSGSAAGDYSMGMVRVRGQPINTGTVLPIGETSEIVWGDGQTLTIVDEFVLWQRHWRVLSINNPADTLYMDYDIQYNGQNDNPDPVPIIGPHASVMWLPIIGGPANIQFDATNSYVGGGTALPGGTLYLWTSEGSVAIDDPTSATPIITYDTPGVYRVSCTVSTIPTGGKAFTSYRYVFVYDDSEPAYKDFVLNECSGDWDEGGWSFKITAYDNAMRSDIRDKALVVLFAKDVYGDEETSIGPLSLEGRGNVIAMGWIDGESIAWNPVKGNVEFEVQGPHWWLKQMGALPDEIADTDFSGAYDEDGVTPVVYPWNMINDLTIEKGTHRFLKWRTTIHKLLDVPSPSNDTLIAYFDTTKGNLWEQLVSMTKDTTLFHPCFDRYGILRIQLEPQLVSAATRNFTTVMDITRQDWMSQIGIERATVNKVGSVYISGTIYVGGAVDPSCAEGGGDSGGPGHHGGFDRIDRLALDNAAQAAELAVLVKAWRNNPYPSISIPLSSNNRTMDICPQQWVSLTIEEDDTERGIIFTNKKMIPRHVSINYDSAIGRILVDVVVEADTAADVIAGRAGGAAAGVPCPEAPERDPIDPFVPPNFPGIPPIPPFPDIPGIDPLEFATGSIVRSVWHWGSDACVPLYQWDLDMDVLNVTGTASLLFSSTDARYPRIFSDDEYVYYRKVSTGDITRYALADGSTSTLDPGNGPNLVNNITLVEKNLMAALVEAGSGATDFRSVDFSDDSMSTLFTISEPGGEDREQTNFIMTIFYQEQLITIFDITWVDQGSSDVTRVVWYFYNWTTGVQTSEEVLNVTGENTDLSDIILESPPVFISNRLVAFYTLEWLSVEATLWSYIVERNMFNGVVRNTRVTNEGDGNDVNFYQASPQRQASKIYFLVTLGLITLLGRYDPLNLGAVSITDIGGLDQAKDLPYSYNQSYRVNELGSVIRSSTGIIRAGVPLISDIGISQPAPMHPGIAPMADNRENRIWTCTQNASRLRGYTLNSSGAFRDFNIGLSLSGQDITMFLHNNKIFVVEGNVGSPFYNVYLVV